MRFVVRHITNTILDRITTVGEYAYRTMVGQCDNNPGTIDVFILTHSISADLTSSFLVEHDLKARLHWRTRGNVQYAQGLPGHEWLFC